MTCVMSWPPLGRTWPVADLHLVDAPDVTWRVERTGPPLVFSKISPIDAAGGAGNRFDVPGAGVLYTATEPGGALAETLARFRPSADLLLQMNEHPDDGFPPAGLVDPSWVAMRRLRSIRLESPLKFVDVDDPRTHTYLTKHAARELLGVGVKNLDVAVMRGAERRVTRALAAWIYSQTDEHGQPLYSGIRYTSRLGDYECWAIFDGTQASVASETRLEGHTAVSEIAGAFDLTLG